MDVSTLGIILMGLSMVAGGTIVALMAFGFPVPYAPYLLVLLMVLLVLCVTLIVIRSIGKRPETLPRP